MANLKIELKGEGTVDNAAMFLDDPLEKFPHYLQKDDDTSWSLDDVSIPMSPGDNLVYTLYVVAFSGTKFSCVITEKDSGGTISFSDVTGKWIKNRAITKGDKAFSE